MQSVASLTADPGSRVRPWSCPIDSEIISTFILLLPLIREGLLSVTSESMCMKNWLTAKSSVPRKKAWLGELIVST